MSQALLVLLWSGTGMLGLLRWPEPEVPLAARLALPAILGPLWYAMESERQHQADAPSVPSSSQSLFATGINGSTRLS